MSHVTLLTGPDRRRRWSEEDQCRILAAAFAPGATVAAVARQYDVATSLIYKWRRTEASQRLAVSFQQVVHPVRTGKAEVVEASVILGGPDERARSLFPPASAAPTDACDGYRDDLTVAPSALDGQPDRGRRLASDDTSLTSNLLQPGAMRWACDSSRSPQRRKSRVGHTSAKLRSADHAPHVVENIRQSGVHLTPRASLSSANFFMQPCSSPAWDIL
jgi:transposase-like protein